MAITDSATPAFDLSLLPPEESLDTDELGEDVYEAGYSPLDWRPAELSWGFTHNEARSNEPLSARLARELPDGEQEVLGDGIGDATDTDGEIIDDQVGAIRAGRLAWAPRRPSIRRRISGCRTSASTAARHQPRKRRSTSSPIRMTGADAAGHRSTRT